MNNTYEHDIKEQADFTLNNILDISSEGFWDWNALTGHVDRSPGWYRMLDYEIDMFKKDVYTWEDVIHPDDYHDVMKHFESYVNGETNRYKIQYRCRKSDGTYIWIEDSGKIVERTEDGKVARMIGAHTNIHTAKVAKNLLLSQNELLSIDKLTLERLIEERTKELYELNQKLQEQILEAEYSASHDMLTGIYNRRMFETIFEKEMHRAKRYSHQLSVLIFDIDDFKQINDTHGHKIGDEVLIDIAVLAKNHLRESDVIARWGGEEFIAILPETSLEDTCKKAEQLRENIESTPFTNSLQITCSFGITSYLKDDNADSLFIRCDDALYRSKEFGKNRVYKL